MIAILRIVHLLALAVFVGSIGGHILLAAMGEPGVAEYAWAQEAKHRMTLALTLPGLALTGASGLALALLRGRAVRRRWLGLKILLVAVIALNGALLLSPLGAALAEGAATGMAAAELRALGQREALFGALNLGLIVLVTALVVIRPRLGARP